MLVGLGEKWILREYIPLVVKPHRKSRRLLWCVDGGVLFKRPNLFWALLWNDNSLSCCRWSCRSCGQQGQSESNAGAARRFTRPAVPMPIAAVGPANIADRRVWGWRWTDSSRKGNGFPLKVAKHIWMFMCIYTKLWVWLPLRTKLGFCVHFLMCCVPMEDAGVCDYSANKTWTWSTCLRLNSVQSSMADNKGGKS